MAEHKAAESRTYALEHRDINLLNGFDLLVVPRTKLPERLHRGRFGPYRIRKTDQARQKQDVNSRTSVPPTRAGCAHFIEAGENVLIFFPFSSHLMFAAGLIPAELGNLKGLHYLDLNANQLSGEPSKVHVLMPGQRLIQGIRSIYSLFFFANAGHR